MLIFVFKRIAQVIVVVWLSVTLLFAIFYVVPGDKVDQVMGGDRILDASTKAATRHNLGLDKPVYVQYVKLWDNLLHGDLGKSYVSGTSVSETIETKAPASIRLAIWALIVEIIVGTGTAIVVMSFRSRWLRGSSTVVSVVCLSVPVFLLGFVLQLTLGVFPFQHGWPDWTHFETQGIGPDTWAFLFPVGDQWKYLALPAVTLGVISGAVAHRLGLESMKRAKAAPFVQGAMLRGVSERRVLLRHIVRNAAGPIVALLGVDIVALFGSAIVAESVFSWPGIGGELARALTRADAPVIFGLTVVLAAAYATVNIVVDIAHRLIDPRVGENRS